MKTRRFLLSLLVVFVFGVAGALAPVSAVPQQTPVKLCCDPPPCFPPGSYCPLN